ncbi:MAG: hypothetical protein KDB21_08230 [Acidimicrobiales bacterium]|nr:hypothetical protein [Acidimicrobiales bacterium]
MKRMVGTIALVGVLGFGAVACGDDDDSGGGANSELVDRMVAEGAPRDEAECMVDKLGDDAEVFLSADEEISEEMGEKLFEALTECGIE